MPFREIVVAGVNLVRSAIQSIGFVTGLTGWRIERDGSAEFNNATFRGELIVGVPPAAHIEISTFLDGSNLVPFIEFYSADSDEAQAAFIDNNPIPSTGRIPFVFMSSDRDDSANRAEMQLITGSDASPGATRIEFEGETFQVANSAGNLIYDTTQFDVDAGLNYNLASSALDVAGDVTVGGILVAANMVFGTVSITPVANTPTSQAVSFPATLTGSTFICVATAQTVVPGSTLIEVSYSALTATGVTIWIYRTNTTATTVSYFVIGV